LTYMPSGVE